MTTENSQRAEERRAPDEYARVIRPAAVEDVAADDGDLAMGEIHHAARLVENDNACCEQRVGAGQDDDGCSEFHWPAFQKSGRRRLLRLASGQRVDYLKPAAFFLTQSLFGSIAFAFAFQT